MRIGNVAKAHGMMPKLLTWKVQLGESTNAILLRSANRVLAKLFFFSLYIKWTLIIGVLEYELWIMDHIISRQFFHNLFSN